MYNRCGCSQWQNDDYDDYNNCNRGVNARSVNRLLCEAQRILNEEKCCRRNCEHRCACQYRQCIRRCDWD